MAEKKNISISTNQKERKGQSTVKKTGKKKGSKTGEETNEKLVVSFSKEYQIPARCSDTLEALCNRADNSSNVQATSVSSDEGQRIVSYLSRVGIKKVGDWLQRKIEIIGGEINFHPRATKAGQLQEVA